VLAVSAKLEDNAATASASIMPATSLWTPTASSVGNDQLNNSAQGVGAVYVFLGPLEL
jgi:hypothetical protein